MNKMLDTITTSADFRCGNLRLRIQRLALNNGLDYLVARRSLFVKHNQKMANKDVRWIQRFQNFEKAFLKLAEAMEVNSPNELERNGIIQRFEFTLDLSWKVLKDFLEDEGFIFKPSPKDTIRLGQESGFINYAQELIDGLDIRNELSHDYSGEKFERSETQLREQIFPALKLLHRFFLDELKSIK